MRLNLKNSIVNEYYKTKSQRIYSILSTMEPIESWVLDTDKTISDAIVELTDALNSVSGNTLSENKEELIKVLAYMSSGKVLFFTEWLDKNFDSDISTEFLHEAINLYEDSAEFSIYVERIDTINKMNILGAIFSEKRLNKIVILLDKIRENIKETEDVDFF